MGAGLQKWIDLKDNISKAKLKIALVDGEDGHQRRFLFILGMSEESFRWKSSIDNLGFIPSPNKKYLVRQIKENESVKPAFFKSVFPNATICELQRSEIVLDLKPNRHLREAQDVRSNEESSVAVETGSVIRLGRNADSDEVFSTPMGRYIQRQNGSKVYETDLLGPATFLRAPDHVSMGQCSDGFVNGMLHGEVQHSNDLESFIKAITNQDGPYSVEMYESVADSIDSALVRALSSTYDNAQDAYGDASRLYEFMPPYKGSPKGLGAMPLPLSVISQRLLGDTTDKVVLVPNAWDGISFSFLPIGSKIKAFRGAKDLSRNVGEVRANDVTWNDQFDPARENGADALFFNADPIKDTDGTRRDFKQALSALRALRFDARAVIVLSGVPGGSDGSVDDETRQFLDAISRRYDMDSAVEISAHLTKKLNTNCSMRVISLRNRPAGSDTIRVPKFKVLHSWDDLKTSVDETIATIKLREVQTQGIDIEALVKENEFQRPYIAFSKVGEARTMVPKNLQNPLQYAISKLEEHHGPIDAYVEKKLGFGPNTLEERFSPEQVDAIGLGVSRMSAGRGIIIGDETGIGKGRILSAYCTWAEKQDKKVIFVTDRSNLFNDLLRDLKDIGEWGRFNPLIMNSDGDLTELSEKDGVEVRDVIQKATPSKVMNKILADGMTLEQLQCNIIFTTYSQISNADSPKAEWLLAQADNALVIVDEAHIAAGSNSNTSQVVSELVNRAWSVAYSSATWAKTSNNLHVFSRAFPDTINVASLSSTMKTGGEAFSEVFSSMLARDGAFIRREHDLSKIEFNVEVDEKRVARNEHLSDKVSEILTAMNYLSGDVNRLLMKLNTNTVATLKAAREARAASRSDDGRSASQGSVLRSNFGAGSVMYQVMRRFLAILNADNVSDLALKAIAENRKPVIVFEDTGEVFIKRLLQEGMIPGFDGESDSAPEFIRAPTIRDLLNSVMKRLGVISVNEMTDAQMNASVDIEVEADEAEDAVIDLDNIAQAPEERQGTQLLITDLPGISQSEQASYKKGISEILEMIQKLPPLPLNAIDIVHSRLADAGLSVGEISGRSLRLEVPDDMRNSSIDDEAWAHTQMKVIRRSHKKIDVTSTIRGFNFGRHDAIVINRSAATGISLHSSPKFDDIRKRELIEMQIPEDPTNRIQLYGRVNRYDQVVTPRITIATTGIFGEVRQLMQQNKKLSRLSSNIRSSRENAAEIKSIPDLLNPVGNEVCLRFLEDNGGIRNRIGVSSSEMESSAFEAAKKLTSRVCLLSVTEQKMVYEEVYELFHDAIARYELMGENPLKAKELDIGATIKSSKIIVGRELDVEGSAFDGPVYLRELMWTEAKRPYGWNSVIDLVKEGSKKMVDSGFAAKLANVRGNGENFITRASDDVMNFSGPKNITKKERVVLDEMREALDKLSVDLFSGAHPDSMDAQLSFMGSVESYARKNDEYLDLKNKYQDFLSKLSDSISRDVYASNSVEASVGSGLVHDIDNEPTPMSLIGEDGRYTEKALRGFETKEKLIPNISIETPVAKLIRILEAKTRIELVGSTFPNIDAAISAPGMNGVKRANFKKLWVEKYFSKVTPGCTIGVNFERENLRGFEFKKWGVITSITPPARGREAMLSKWKVNVVFPGENKQSAYTLSSMMEGIGVTGLGIDDVVSDVELGENITGNGYLHNMATGLSTETRNYRRSIIQDKFSRESRRSLIRKGAVLDGNMYLASEWATIAKLGHGVIYTDDKGARHRGVWLNDKIVMNPEIIERMPIRLWKSEMINNFLKKIILPEDMGGPSKNGPAGTFLFSTSFQGAIPSLAGTDTGTKVMVMPGKAIALMVDKGDLQRMLRSLRGYSKSVFAKAHPDYKNYSVEQKEAANLDTLKISSSKKRGTSPVILLDCQTDTDFPKVVDALCHAGGIEFYVTRHTELGDIALASQNEYFDNRGRQQNADELQSQVITDVEPVRPVENVAAAPLPEPIHVIANEPVQPVIRSRFGVIRSCN